MITLKITPVISEHIYDFIVEGEIIKVTFRNEGQNNFYNCFVACPGYAVFEFCWRITTVITPLKLAILVRKYLKLRIKQ